MLSVNISGLVRAYCPSALRPWLDRLEASNIGLRLARGAFWSLAATAFTRVFSVCASFFIARSLGQTGFGEYGVIFSTVALMGTFAGLGIGETVVKYTAALRIHDPDRAGRIIGFSSLINWTVSAICAVIFWLIAPWLAEHTLAAPHLTGMLRLSALCVMLSIVNGAQTAALAGFEAFKANAIIGTWTSILGTIFTIVGCAVGGLSGLIVGLTISSVVSVIVYRIAMVRQMQLFAISIQWRRVFAEWPVFLQFSLPAFLASSITGPALWICSAFLANHPNGHEYAYAQLGILKAADQWFTAIQFLPGMLGTAMLPVLSERYAAGDIKSTIRIMKGMTIMAVILAIPLVLILWLLSKPIMAMYGPAFVDGHRVLMTHVVTAAIGVIMNPVWFVIITADKMWAGFYMNLGWIAIVIITSWLTVQWGWGAEGLAVSRLLATVFRLLWMLVFVQILLRRALQTCGNAVSVSTLAV